MKLPRWELRHTADPLDTRAYGGGGGDGGSAQMQAAEQDRQRKVQSAVDAINRKFGVGSAPIPGDPQAWKQQQFDMWLAQNPTAPPDMQEEHRQALDQVIASAAGNPEAELNRSARESQYSDISSAVRDAAMRDVDRQYGAASNRNKFGLARSGLLGGTVDVESGANLRELYGEGRLKATEAGVNAAADLRGQDEKSRQNLVSLAQSGLDTGTAASMAAGQMASAADSARSAAAGASVGRLFDDLSQAYVLNQVGKARYGQPAQQQPSTYGTGVFGTNRYTGTVGR